MTRNSFLEGLKHPIDAFSDMVRNAPKGDKTKEDAKKDTSKNERELSTPS